MRLTQASADPVPGAHLASLHAELAVARSAPLTAQDRQPLRPHVTVQDKALPDDVERAVAGLAAGPPPPRPRAVSLQVRPDRGGPWERAGEVRWPEAS